MSETYSILRCPVCERQARDPGYCRYCQQDDETDQETPTVEAIEVVPLPSPLEFIEAT